MSDSKTPNLDAFSGTNRGFFNSRSIGSIKGYNFIRKNDRKEKTNNFMNYSMSDNKKQLISYFENKAKNSSFAMKEIPEEDKEPDHKKSNLRSYLISVQNKKKHPMVFGENINPEDLEKYKKVAQLVSDNLSPEANNLLRNSFDTYHKKFNETRSARFENNSNDPTLKTGLIGKNYMIKDQISPTSRTNTKNYNDENNTVDPERDEMIEDAMRNLLYKEEIMSDNDALTGMKSVGGRNHGFDSSNSSMLPVIGKRTSRNENNSFRNNITTNRNVFLSPKKDIKSFGQSKDTFLEVNNLNTFKTQINKKIEPNTTSFKFNIKNKPDSKMLDLIGNTGYTSSNRFNEPKTNSFVDNNCFANADNDQSQFSNEQRPVFYPFSYENTKSNFNDKFGITYNNKEFRSKNLIMGDILDYNNFRCKWINSSNSTDCKDHYDKLIGRINVNSEALDSQPKMRVVSRVDSKVMMKPKKSKDSRALKKNKTDATEIKHALMHIMDEELSFNQIEIKIMCFPITITDLHYLPDSREGATINYHKNKSFYVGGFSTHPIGEISILDHNKLFWEKSNIRQQDNVPEGSFPNGFHTSIVFQDFLYVFGGCNKDTAFGTVWEYDMKRQVWNHRRTYGDFIEPRKNHVACYTGMGNMFVHGGSNTNDTVLDSCMSLCFHTFKWMSYYCNEPFPCLTSHASASVLKATHAQTQRELNLLSQYEGVWVFGGKNGEEKPMADLYHFKIHDLSIKINKVVPRAKGPCARYSHNMIHIPKKHFLVVIGGRNDEKFATMLTNSFDDLHILDYRHNMWCSVKWHGTKTYGARYNFSVSTKENSLFIIGGLSDGLLLDQTPISLILDVDYNTINTLGEILQSESYSSKLSMKINNKLEDLMSNKNKSGMNNNSGSNKRDSVIDSKVDNQFTNTVFGKRQSNFGDELQIKATSKKTINTPDKKLGIIGSNINQKNTQGDYIGLSPNPLNKFNLKAKRSSGIDN